MDSTRIAKAVEDAVEPYGWERRDTGDTIELVVYTLLKYGVDAMVPPHIIAELIESIISAVKYEYGISEERPSGSGQCSDEH